MKYFSLFVTVAMITGIVSFFLINIATIVKEINSFDMPISRRLWLQNLAGWWVTLTGFHPQSYSTLWSRSHARSHDKLKSLQQFLWLPNLAGWQLTLMDFYPKSQWSFDHVISLDFLGWLWSCGRSHVTNYNNYIFTTTVSMKTKLDTLALYLERIPLITLWSCSLARSRDKPKKYLY